MLGTGGTPVLRCALYHSLMIDTHCHLSDPRLYEQLDGVLRRCEAAGVRRMITIGTTLDDAQRAVALCHQHPNVRCAIGVHPNHSADAEAGDIERLGDLQTDASVAALGEMGLDYHHAFASRQRQLQFFEPQLQLATQLGRPVVIHCREANDDCLSVMKAFALVRAVFHCFTGDSAEARKILDAGYWLGFTGALTFKKSDAIREAAALTPSDRLLVETDSPYLTPEPMRKQKTNEPALVVHVVEVMAKVRGVNVEEIDRITTANALRFFEWE